MKYIYLAVFIIFTSMHLIASYRNHKHFRDVTKGFILFSLLGLYLEVVGNDRSWFIILALLFSWIGDMLLIIKGTKWFVFGGISFEISHIFFILAYISLSDFSKNIYWILIPLGILFLISVTIIFKKLSIHLPKPLIIPMAIYLLINGTMNCFAVYRCISMFSLGSLITVIGAFLFFISDTALFFVRFNKESKMQSHFLVMMTYSLGEFLILSGLMF